MSEPDQSKHPTELENVRNTLNQGSLSQVVASVADYAIILLDAEGRVASWNAGAQRIKGYEASEIIGKHFSIFYPAEAVSRGRTEQALRKAASAGKFSEEGWRVRKDGSRFWASVLITPIRNADGTLAGFLKIDRDRTERRKFEALQEVDRRKSEFLAELENQVQERTAQLTEANAQLEAFAYTVSHDLKAPLRGIRGFARALMEDYQDKLDGQARDYLRRIEEGAERMQALIEDLLAHSQLSRAEFRLTVVDLESVVDEALRSLDGEVRMGNAAVSIKKPLPDVIAHRSALVQAIQNLLSNAIKFTRKSHPPCVEIFAEGNDERTRLYVQDHGIGIEERHFDRIFQVFERLHGAETFSGTGIGLAIVKKAIERMGGSCGVESQVGSGSRFWIELATG
jgi:PAS domain S-box-containing protein